MDRIRWGLLALTAWGFFIYGLERISESLQLASFVYLLIFAVAAVMIAFPGMDRRPFAYVALVVLAIYFTLKVALDDPIAGPGLPVTIIEVTSLLGSGFLIQQVLIRLAALQEAVARLILPIPKESISFEIAQGQMYREIRRARRHRRSAALLAISPSPSSLKYSLDRFMEETVRALNERYLTARLAHLLVEELDDHNIVAQQDGSFVVLLPEAGTEEADEIAQRLQRASVEQLGLDLRIGRAHFPQDAVTFDQLLADAEAQLLERGARPRHPVKQQPETAEDQQAVQI
jgi:GGDEF domain-containing protein